MSGFSALMRVLLVDTGFSAAPIYDALLHFGHDVWVMGNRETDVVARRAGDRWVEQDYSDVEAVSRHVERLSIDCLVPGCTDVSLETCAAIPSPLGSIDSLETTLILGSKHAFRKTCAELGLPAPRVYSEAEFPTPGSFICKPVDAYSGRGVSVFDGLDQAALAQALETATAQSRTNEALIETFCDGPLHSCSAFLENQSVVESFIVREGSSVNPYAVDTSYVVEDFPKERSDIITQSLEALARHLDLKDGLLHVQFVGTPDGPMLIEVMRRCPGDLYALLIEFSCGVHYARRYAGYFTGDKVTLPQKTHVDILRHTVTSETEGVFSGLFLDKPENIRAFYPIGAMGLQLLPNQGSRAGLLFVQARDKSDLEACFNRFMSRQAYRVR